jgi:hypothetical protein
MPPNVKSKDGWTVVDRGLLRQQLAQSEAEPFLDWLFSDLAERPETLSLRESASVVRYMLWLASHGIPKDVIDLGADAIQKYQHGPRADVHARQDVECIAKIVWDDLLQTGRINAASKTEALTFLRRHASSWNHCSLEPALKFLEDFGLPPGAEPPFRQYPLVAQKFAATGGGNPYLENDLSERIAAADSALQRVPIKNRHALIANALQKSPLTRELRPNDDSWGPIEVRDRVKGYKRQKWAHPGEGLADKWISGYRWDMKLNESIRAWKAKGPPASME